MDAKREGVALSFIFLYKAFLQKYNESRVQF